MGSRMAFGTRWSTRTRCICTCGGDLPSGDWSASQTKGCRRDRLTASGGRASWSEAGGDPALLRPVLLVATVATQRRPHHLPLPIGEQCVDRQDCTVQAQTRDSLEHCRDGLGLGHWSQFGAPLGHSQRMACPVDTQVRPKLRLLSACWGRDGTKFGCGHVSPRVDSLRIAFRQDGIDTTPSVLIFKLFASLVTFR